MRTDSPCWHSLKGWPKLTDAKTETESCVAYPKAKTVVPFAPDQWSICALITDLLNIHCACVHTGFLEPDLPRPPAFIRAPREPQSDQCQRVQEVGSGGQWEVDTPTTNHSPHHPLPRPAPPCLTPNPAPALALAHPSFLKLSRFELCVGFRLICLSKY